MKVIEVEKAYFEKELARLPRDGRRYLDDEIRTDKYYLIYSPDVVGGFTLTRVEEVLEIGAIFSLTKGVGAIDLAIQEAKRVAKQEGDLILQVFCIDVPLRDTYERKGFFEVEAFSWDWKLAPKLWYKDDGEPPLFLMQKYL